MVPSRFLPSVLATLVFFLFVFYFVPAEAQSLTESVMFNFRQCENGPIDEPNSCVSDSWTGDDLNKDRTHYFEGDSVPYRLMIRGLDPDEAFHIAIIEWDTRDQQKHAIDFITSFNVTEMDANPCSGISFCDQNTNSTFLIPDPTSNIEVEEKIQPLESFSSLLEKQKKIAVFVRSGSNVTINDVKYVFEDVLEDPTTSSRLAINFTTSHSSAVISWSAHLADPKDWGTDITAGNLTSFPYHTRVIQVDGNTKETELSLSIGPITTRNFSSVLFESAELSDSLNATKESPKHFEKMIKEELAATLNLSGIKNIPSESFEQRLEEAVSLKDKINTESAHKFLAKLQTSIGIMDNLLPKKNTTAKEFSVVLEEKAGLEVFASSAKNLPPSEFELMLMESLPLTGDLLISQDKDEFVVHLNETIQLADTAGGIKNPPPKSFKKNLDEKLDASSGIVTLTSKVPPPLPSSSPPPPPPEPDNGGGSPTPTPRGGGGGGRTGVSFGGSIGAGGGGFVGSELISGPIILYEASWNICEEPNQMQIIAGPQHPSLGVKVRSTVDGVIKAELLGEQPFEDRSIYEVTLSPNETFVQIQVEGNTSDVGSFVQESIDLRECKGRIVFYTEPEEQIPSRITLEYLLQSSVFAFSYDDNDFKIPYNLPTGSIKEVSVNEKQKSVTFFFEDKITDKLAISLPRNLVDTPQDRFILISNGNPDKTAEYEVIESTQDYVILNISLEDSQKITIFGTRIVPEFGVFALAVLLVPILFVIAYFRMAGNKITRLG